MVHYYTKEECEAKTAELNERQRDPNYDIALTLKKDANGWYADVPTHTRSQNAMVAGSDVICDRLAEGDRELTVKFRTIAADNRKPLCKLRRFAHMHGYGAEYVVTGLSLFPMPAYICDVGHDVMGEHPEHIYVYSVEHK